MAYKSLKEHYIDIVEGKTLKEKGKYTNIWNAIKDVKGVSNKEKDFISNMDPDSLFSVMKAIGKKFPRVMEEVELEEATDLYDKDGIQITRHSMGKGKVGLQISYGKAYISIPGDKAGSLLKGLQMAIKRGARG